jgi:hypothetical protein
VLETGIPVEVIRKGKILKIVPEAKPDKLQQIEEAEMHRGRSRRRRPHGLAFGLGRIEEVT